MTQMSLAGVDDLQFQDYGLANYGLAGVGNEPLDWSTDGLLGFGAYLDKPLPMIDNSSLGLLAEYDDGDTVAMGRDNRGGFHSLVRTKMLQMDPREILHVYRTGRPRHGSVALSDDGQFYSWQETPVGGFFSKIWSGIKKVGKKIRSGVRKAVKWVGSKAKQLIAKLPGGKYLLKIYDKIKAVSMKLVKPLMKVLGPLAKKIAPIAALIPGYGPIITAALYKVGDLAKIVKKFGVLIDDKGRPKFKSGNQAKKVRHALHVHAEKMKRKMSGKKRSGKPTSRKAQRGGGAPAWLTPPVQATAKRGKPIQGLSAWYN